MTCPNCGAENAPVKKCCYRCGAVLAGYTINNVTGEYGYRNPDGSFTTTKETTMDKKTQDLAWAYLPKKARDFIKSDTATAWQLAYARLFGEHNLTSDTEPSELLFVEKKKAVDLYLNLSAEYEEESNGSVNKFCLHAQMDLLNTLFGDKCQPDKEEQNSPKLSNSLQIGKDDQPSVQVEPFKLWDKVRIKPNAKDFHNGYENGYAWLDSRNKHLGKTYQVIGVGKDGSITLNTSETMWWSPIDLEPYTEPETKDNMEEKELNRKALYDALCELETASIKVRKALIAM